MLQVYTVLLLSAILLAGKALEPEMLLLAAMDMLGAVLLFAAGVGPLCSAALAGNHLISVTKDISYLIIRSLWGRSWLFGSWWSRTHDRCLALFVPALNSRPLL